MTEFELCDLIHFQSVLTKADRARMELERELDDLNERLEEQGGATQAQVSKINKLKLNFFISRPQRKSRVYSKNITPNSATFQVLLNVRPTLEFHPQNQNLEPSRTM